MAREPKKGPLVVPDCCEVLLNWSYVSDADVIQWHNVLHATFSTPPSFNQALAQALFDGIKAGMISSGWGNNVSAAYGLRSVWVKDIQQPYLPFFLSGGAINPGTGVLAATAESLAVCVTLKTDKSGRQWRGRTYLGGLDSSVLADGRHHTLAAGQDAVGFLETIFTVFEDNGMQMAIAQRELLAGTDSQGNPLAPRPAHAEPVTDTAITNNRLDTQRRRLGR